MSGGCLDPTAESGTKEETKARVQRTVELLSSLKEAQEQGRDTRPPMRKVFWTVANRFVHKSRPRNPGLTLVLLHGIGAHKEVLDPPFLSSGVIAHETI